MCEGARDVMCSVSDCLVEAVTAAVREMEGGVFFLVCFSSCAGFSFKLYHTLSSESSAC